MSYNDTVRCRVKICGITNLTDAQEAVRLGADALGFVFWKKSPRYICPAEAEKIIKSLSAFVACVGVFVDEKVSRVNRIAKHCQLNCLQLHGQEPSHYCKRFSGLKVIKAFRIKDEKSLEPIAQYDGVHAYLLDTFIEGRPGGTGRSFDWKLATKVKKLGRPIILSGGLNPDNVIEAILKVRPYAVDASTSLERSPGKKDYQLMREFIIKVKQA